MAHLLRSGIALALVLGPNAGVASAQQINGQDLPIGPTANRVNVPDPGCTGNVTYDDSLKTFLQAGGIIAEIAGGLPGAVIEGALDALSVFIKGSSSQNFANCAVSCVQFIKEQEARVSKVSGYFQTNRPGFSLNRSTTLVFVKATVVEKMTGIGNSNIWAQNSSKTRLMYWNVLFSRIGVTTTELFTP